MHMEAAPLCHSPYSDSVPASVIAKVLEKPDEACSSSSRASRSPSPQPQEQAFLLGGGSSVGSMGSSVGERLGVGLTLGIGLRGGTYKSDLYSSDTALYCPDERRRERRPSMDVHGSVVVVGVPEQELQERQRAAQLYGPQNSTDSNPDEGDLGGMSPGPFGGQEHFVGGKFTTSLGGGSSSYSSFSGGGGSDAGGKGQGPLSSGASSPASRHHHHATLYMDWRDAGADYEHKSDSSWERDSPGAFSKAHSFQQELSLHSQNGGSGGMGGGGSGGSPVYSRTMSSCYSEPYEPLPPSSSPSVAAYGDSRRSSALAPDDEEEDAEEDVEEDEELMIGRWRQLSVDDLNTAAAAAHAYRNSPGRASPYSFSEQHFSVRPAKIRLGPLYSSFQEGSTDVYHHHHQHHHLISSASVSGGSGILDPACFSSPSSECSPGGGGGGGGVGVGVGMRQAHSHAQLYRTTKDDSQEESEHSLYHSGGSSKDIEPGHGRAASVAGMAGNVGGGGGDGGGGTGGGGGGPEAAEYVEVSPNSSTESLHMQGALDLAGERELQMYQAEMHGRTGHPGHGRGSSPQRPRPSSAQPHHQYQKFGTLGLTRKDSLTKAQLYGTLLN